ALAAQTDRVAAQAAEEVKAGRPDAARLASWQRWRAAEEGSVLRVLTPAQSTRWREGLGRRMDTARFQRTHPMAPEFPAGARWVDGQATNLAGLRGKVVLVHFYAFQCHNCQANFRTYNRWRKTLRDQGVEMVGIQTPETEAERDPGRVTEAAHQCGFEFPVMLDLDRHAWKAWGNNVWPTVYLVDPRGYVRTWWVGELYWQGARGDQSVEGWIRRLLAEAKPAP
ncbi:MAG: redoxin domain-containing protein, partial [Verrucomicrobiota bacterium]